MSQEPIRVSSRSVQRGFPLAALVLLATVFAVSLVCADTSEWQGRWYNPTLLSVFGGAALLGTLVGCVHGLFYPSRWRGVLCGALGGFTAGLLAALILLAPATPLRSLSGITALLLTAIVIRWGTG